MTAVAVFDGHNDTLTKIRQAPPERRRSFLERSRRDHIDLPRAREGGLAGGIFAIFTPSSDWDGSLKSPMLDDEGKEIPGGYSTELPARLRHRKALRFTISIMSDLFRIAEESEGAVEVVSTADDLDRCIDTGVFAAVLHIEGAEAIDAGLESLEVLYRAGLRSIGPVWSRPSTFAHGVPFDFPRSPDTGPGLTARGRRLVEACNRKGILLDLSHLNAKGFWDVAELTENPLVCSHSNAWALCPSPRCLTDAQLDEVARSDGIVGLNFHVGFLDPQGRYDAPEEVSLDLIVKHARYIADRIGVRHLGLGSDFDGATMPHDLPGAAALPRLIEALGDAGFDAAEVQAIANGNWRRVIRATWGD